MGWLLDQNRQATPPVVFCHPPGPGYFISALRHPNTFTKGGVFSSVIGGDSVAVYRRCAQSLLLGSESVNLRQCMQQTFLSAGIGSPTAPTQN
jgi:hypothetical protein